jgi:acetyl-CoA acetyltransferase
VPLIDTRARPSRAGSPSTEVAIAGIGRTDFSLKSGRTTLALATEAARAALADAGLDPSQVDGIGTFGLNDTAMALTVGDGLGVTDLPWAVDLYGGGNTMLTLVGLAVDAIKAGTASTIVLYRSMNGRSAQRLGDAAEAIAATIPDLHFSLPQGYVVPPQFMAMWARRHQHEFGSTCEDLGRIAVTQRTHAGANPHAIARDPIDLAAYLAGRWINEPLRVFDCAFEVDGAVALVLTSLERARDLAAPPVRILAAVDSQGYGGSWDQWPDATRMFSATVAPKLLDRCAGEIGGIGDIDVACIYDCFTYTVMAVMEDFGFAPKGEIGRFYADGRATYGGDVVVNPHGGLLSEGYLHGFNTHYEAVLQVRGQAGPRQVPDTEVALATAGAGPYGGAAMYVVDR